MHHPSRPPNRPDGSTAVGATRGGGGADPPPAGVSGASAQSSRSDKRGERSSGRPCSAGGGEPEPQSGCRPKTIPPLDSRCVFQTRSTFRLPRRASSGYFSSEGDSLPTSPLSPRPMTADKATQTPSPTAQLIKHCQQRVAEAHQQHGHSPSPSSMRPRNAAGDMQAEAEVGRELQLIGDDYNRFLLRGAAGRHRQVVNPNPLPQIHQEPTMLLCLLLFLIGRIIYSQCNTNTQDHSQV